MIKDLQQLKSHENRSVNRMNVQKAMNKGQHCLLYFNRFYEMKHGVTEIRTIHRLLQNYLFLNALLYSDNLIVFPHNNIE